MTSLQPIQSSVSSSASGHLFLISTVSLIVLMLSHSSSLPAQTIYRCVNSQGAVSYQNAQCGPRQRMTTTHEYTPEPINPSLAAKLRSIEQEMDRRNRAVPQQHRISATTRRNSVSITPCESAKAHREKSLEQVGLHRTFELLSRLDADVWRACKGL